MAATINAPGTIDWLSIKTDYITGRGSYRQLAEKYGIKKDTIYRRANHEKWAEQRDRQRDTIERRVIDRTTDKIADKMAEAYSDNAAAKVRIKGKMLKMAEDWLDHQGGVIHDVTDFRKIVQCCLDMLDDSNSGTERNVRVVMDGEASEYAE